jgi:hypothetical protein
MNNSWDKLLPNEYCNSAMKPLVFEVHTEPSVNAEKTIGLAWNQMFLFPFIFNDC